MLPNIVTMSAMKCFNENTEYKEVLARRYSMHMQISRFLGISRQFVKLKKMQKFSMYFAVTQLGWLVVTN